MRFLVTGGSGFIGSYLVNKLSKMNHKVLSFDLVPSKIFNSNVKSILADIKKYKDLNKVASNCDGIFHCAGIVGSSETFSYFKETIEVNMLGTLNILNVAKNFNIPLINLSLKNDSMNPYMISKRKSNELCESFYQYLGTPVCTINGLNGYGPQQLLKPTPKMLPSMILKILNNEKIQINGDGQQIVDMIYVEDLVDIMYLAFQKKCWGATFDAGTGIPRTVNQIAKDVIKIIGKGKIEYLQMRKGEPANSIALADPTFALKTLDYYPKTDWYFGLNKTVKWYKDYFESNI